MSLLAMERKRSQNPDPFETERAGHPEKPNQSPRVDVLEWYHPIVCVRQQKKYERAGHPPRMAVAIDNDRQNPIDENLPEVRQTFLASGKNFLALSRKNPLACNYLRSHDRKT
jgi:hypothetical protein